MVRRLEGTPSLPKTQKRIAGEIKSPVRLPFSDDNEEKSRRLQTRTGLNDAHIASIIATSSPKKVLRPYDRATSGSPSVLPSRVTSTRQLQAENMLPQPFGDNSPAKRIPILANFEEWMKMATDNKINATNSWNFALIDYFHDLSLLKEGESVNFQKASCTLDGCVKIYTNRVDSVATETGKLLSGLSENKPSKDVGTADSDEENGSDHEKDSEESGRGKKVVKKAAISEATIASSFAALSLKKFDLEFSIDPLFKKASADFDEGGAKGLLLNNLAINNHGRVCFDSCSDRENDGLNQQATESESVNLDRSISPETAELNLSSLRETLFSNILDLESKRISAPSENFILGEKDVNYDMSGINKRASESPTQKGSQLIAVLGDDALKLDVSSVPDFVVPGAEDYGSGGDEWLGDQQNDTWGERQPVSNEHDNHEYGSSSTSAFTLQKSGQDHQFVLDYFDDKLISNWAGPEHWKVERLKAMKRPGDSTMIPRKVREPFEIDFLDDSNSKFDELTASHSSSINLPKSQWQSVASNLLPDDERFASAQLLRLFTKPKARLARQNAGRGSKHVPGRGVYNLDVSEPISPRGNGLGLPTDQETFNQADFFMGMDPVAISEGDIPETLESITSNRLGEDGRFKLDETDQGRDRFGDQLVASGTRTKTEYVQYARQAKKVDVRRLKEELWQGLSDGQSEDQVYVRQEHVMQEDKNTPDMNHEQDMKRFTSVINNLQDVYDDSAMADISTSYCFICLLHLANEKGLTIQGDESLEELSIDTRVRSYTTAEGS